MTSIEFEKHSIHQILEQLSERLSQDEVKEIIEIDKFNFYDSTVKYIKDRVKLTIPILVLLTELDSIATDLINGLNTINTYLGNNNVGYLNSADSYFNGALNKIRNLPLPFSKNDFNFAKNIASFESTVKTKLQEVEKENQNLKDELKVIQDNLGVKQKEIEKMSTLLTTKTNEINNLTSTFQTNYENIKNTANQNFENDKKTYRTEITTDRDTYRKEITQDRETFRKEVDSKINKIESDTSTIVENINTKLEEARKLVNVIGNVGVTGNYQNIANHHEKTANLWRWIAIAFMFGMSALLIIAIWNVSSANYDWIKSVIRIIAAAALAYPATYASKESSKHRKLETLNRKLELELASLTPFIEMHSDDEKNKIKSKLIDKYFGNNLEISDEKTENEEDFSLGVIEKILKTFLPFIKK